MKFWDSSGIVPLVVREEESSYCCELLYADQEMVVWCLCRLEVLSALCRRLREEVIDESVFDEAKVRLSSIFKRTYEVTALEKVRSRAARLLEVHPLRAADACQLAAALVATGEDPLRLELVSFDKRLATAARREGFRVNPAK
jgi:predicted nucleic acid-binding protein